MARENKDPIVRGNPSQALPHNFESETTSTLAEVSGLINEKSNANHNSDPPLSRLSRGVRPKLSTLEIPRRSDVSVILGRQACPLTCYFEPPDSLSDGYETAEESSMDEEVFMVSKSNLFIGGQEEDENDPIPREKIMKRINSHKGMKSYQLACQLSTRWTTGAGPRIGCMRDYPPELQFRILEQQNMSPRTRTIARNPYPRVPSVSRFGQTS